MGDILVVPNFSPSNVIFSGKMGKKKFYPLSEAVPLWDKGFLRVEDSHEILLEDATVRKMTDEENRAFQNRVDEFSASK